MRGLQSTIISIKTYFVFVYKPAYSHIHVYWITILSQQVSVYGGVAQRVGRLTRNVEVVGPSPTLSKKLNPYWLVLVGSRNGFERDFTIELKKIEGLCRRLTYKSNKPPSLNIVKTKRKLPHLSFFLMLFYFLKLVVFYI